MYKKRIGLFLWMFLSTFCFTQEIQKPADVSVVFKYTPREVLQYKFSGTGEGKLKLSSKDTTLNAYGFNTSLPIDLSFEGYITASTLSVSSEGNGTFNVKLDKAELSGSLFDQKVKFTFENRIFKMYTNGELYMQENLDSVGQKAYLKKPVTLTFTNRGQLMDINSPDIQDIKKTPEGKKYNMDNWKNQVFPLLPDKPLAAGDHWESTTKIELPSGLVLSKPVQVINSFTVDGFRDMDGENCLIVKTKTNNDFSGVSFSTDTVQLPSIGGNGKMDMKFKTGKVNASGEIVIGVNSGKLKKLSGEKSLVIDLTLRVPLAEKVAREFALNLSGSLSGALELQK